MQKVSGLCNVDGTVEQLASMIAKMELRRIQVYVCQDVEHADEARGTLHNENSSSLCMDLNIDAPYLQAPLLYEILSSNTGSNCQLNIKINPLNTMG